MKLFLKLSFFILLAFTTSCEYDLFHRNTNPTLEVYVSHSNDSTEIPGLIVHISNYYSDSTIYSFEESKITDNNGKAVFENLDVSKYLIVVSDDSVQLNRSELKEPLEMNKIIQVAIFIKQLP